MKKKNILNNRWLIGIGGTAAIILAVVISTFPILTVTASTKYLSLDIQDVTMTVKPPEQRFAKTSEAITLSTLGTPISDKTATSPWTAMTGLSLTADDYVFVCDSADTASSTMMAYLDGTDRESNTTATPGNNFYGTTWLSQSFTASASYTLSAVKLLLFTGGVAKPVNVAVYLSDANDKPTGSVLTSGTKTAIALINWMTIPVTPYAVTNATKYNIVVSCPTGDATNYYAWYYANSNPYASGMYATSSDSGASWTTNGSNDFAFKTASGDADSIALTADVTATNATHAVTKIWSGKVSVTGTAWYIVVTNTSTAKAVTAYKASGLASSSVCDLTNNNTGTGTDVLTNSTGTLSQNDELVIVASGVEDEVDDGHGTWTSGAGHVSGDVQFAATNGGGDTSNIQVHSAAVVVSATTSMHGDDTGHDSSSWAGCVASYKMAASYAITETTTSKAFGTVAVSTTYWAIGHTPDNPIDDAHCTFTITNSGIACDLDIKMADFTGGVGWNIEETADPAADEVMIYAFYSGQDPSAGLIVKNADAEFYDSLGVGAHVHWELKMVTGSSFTDGAAKSGVLTITAVAED